MPRPETTRLRLNRRAVIGFAGFSTVVLALAGCGASVAAGGENAATNPASGIWESNTVGGAGVSGRPEPKVPLTLPSSQPPQSVPSGSGRLVSELKRVVGPGGCWEDAHEGNNYGAYDQWFWWLGQCNDTMAMVSVELYASAGQALRQAHHPSDTALLGRFRAGAVLVDVYANAPGEVASAVSGTRGLKAVPGYGLGS